MQDISYKYAKGALTNNSLTEKPKKHARVFSKATILLNCKFMLH